MNQRTECRTKFDFICGHSKALGIRLSLHTEYIYTQHYVKKVTLFAHDDARYLSLFAHGTALLISFAALLCVLWWGVLDRLCLRAAQFVRVCSTTGYITSSLRGPSPKALTLFGGVGFIARRLRRPEKGNADGVRGIFGTACRVGLRPCDRTHLKNGLVPHSYAGGA